MPVSDNIETYGDVERAFRYALANPSGALQKIPGDSPDQIRRKAIRWRARAYRFRELLRKQNRAAFAGTSRDAEKDKTIYDELVIRLIPDGVRIEREGLDLPAPVALDGVIPAERAIPENDVVDLIPPEKPDFTEALELARKIGLNLEKE